MPATMRPAVGLSCRVLLVLSAACLLQHAIAEQAPLQAPTRPPTSPPVTPPTTPPAIPPASPPATPPTTPPASPPTTPPTTPPASPPTTPPTSPPATPPTPPPTAPPSSPPSTPPPPLAENQPSPAPDPKLLPTTPLTPSPHSPPMPMPRAPPSFPPPQAASAALAFYTNGDDGSSKCVDVQGGFLNNGILLVNQDCNATSLLQNYAVSFTGIDPVFGELLVRIGSSAESKYCWTAFGDKPDGVEDTAPPPSEYEDPYMDPWKDAKYWDTVGLWKCSAADGSQDFIISSSSYSPNGFFLRPLHARNKCAVGSLDSNGAPLQLVDCDSTAMPPEFVIPKLEGVDVPGMVAAIVDSPPPRPPRPPLAPVRRFSPPSPPRPPHPPPPPPPPGQQIAFRTYRNMCIQLVGGLPINGTRLEQTQCVKCGPTSKPQKFRMMPDASAGGWYYRIGTIINPRKCLALDGGMTSNGTPVVIADCSAVDPSQDFMVTPLASGRYALKPRNAPGLCVDVMGNLTLPGSRLGIVPCNAATPGQAVQMENFVHPVSIVSGTPVAIHTAAPKSKCVHIPGGTPIHGIDLMQQSCVEGTKSQKFIAEAVGLPPGGNQALQMYRIKSIDQKMCWFIGGLLSANGSSVSMIECDSSDATQLFYMPLTVEGWRLIKLQLRPTKCVSVKDLTSDKKSALITWDCVSNPVPQLNQRFNLTRI